MNRWCYTGRLASRDIGNVASMETEQRSHVIRVTAMAASQYGHAFETFAGGSTGCLIVGRVVSRSFNKVKENPKNFNYLKSQPRP